MHGPESHISSTHARSPQRKAILLSVLAALATIALKFLAYFLTGSVGLFSDAMESMVNLLGAVVALIALTIAARPADREHHYGHTKVEYFSSGLEGGLILVAAVAVGWAAVDRLITPAPLQEIGLGLGVSMVATVINFVVARRLLHVGHAEDSIALEADGKHLMTDVITSVGVVFGLALVWLTGWLWLDPLLAIAVAINIVREGWHMVRRSIDGLIDRSLPEEDLATIRSVIDTVAKAHHSELDFHGLRTRKSGRVKFVELHLLTPGEWTVSQAHDVAHEIEDSLRGTFRNLEASIHIEPIEDPRAYEDSWEAKGRREF